MEHACLFPYSLEGRSVNSQILMENSINQPVQIRKTIVQREKLASKQRLPTIPATPSEPSTSITTTENQERVYIGFNENAEQCF